MIAHTILLEETCFPLHLRRDVDFAPISLTWLHKRNSFFSVIDEMFLSQTMGLIHKVLLITRELSDNLKRFEIDRLWLSSTACAWLDGSDGKASLQL